MIQAGAKKKLFVWIAIAWVSFLLLLFCRQPMCLLLAVTGSWGSLFMLHRRWRSWLITLVSVLSCLPFLISVSLVHGSSLPVEWMEAVLWLSPVYHVQQLFSNPWVSTVLYSDSLFHYSLAAPSFGLVTGFALLAAVSHLCIYRRAKD